MSSLSLGSESETSTAATAAVPADPPVSEEKVRRPQGMRSIALEELLADLTFAEFQSSFFRCFDCCTAIETGSGDKFIGCSACRIVFFCCSDHQQRSAAIHALVCEKLRLGLLRPVLTEQQASFSKPPRFRMRAHGTRW